MFTMTAETSCSATSYQAWARANSVTEYIHFIIFLMRVRCEGLRMKWFDILFWTTGKLYTMVDMCCASFSAIFVIFILVERNPLHHFAGYLPSRIWHLIPTRRQPRYIRWPHHDCCRHFIQPFRFESTKRFWKRITYLHGNTAYGVYSVLGVKRCGSSTRALAMQTRCSCCGLVGQQIQV